jgi:hypothetical protein
MWWFYNKLERYCVRGLQRATWGEPPLFWPLASKLEFWMRGKLRKK